MRYILAIIVLLSLLRPVFSQGNIDHIKNQSYLQLKGSVDCNHSAGDNLSDRICANLAYQKSDSILCQVYDSLLQFAETHFIDSLNNKVIRLQATWRQFRDQHCSIVYDSYKGCASCHMQAIDYLQCLRELTEERIRELRKLMNSI